MSWFTSFFSIPEPHDAKRRATPLPHEQRLLEEPATTSSRPLAQRRPETTQSPARRAEPDRRRNKIIFGAGATFFAFSLLVTRRSFARKRLASQAQFYTNAPGHQADQATKVNGATEALEALSVATINVLSLAMMLSGAALWYTDINSMDDARRLLRGGLGVDGTGRSEKEAEDDFEEWLASTLSRKEFKEAMKKERPLLEEPKR